jgi:hypothetical protein
MSNERTMTNQEILEAARRQQLPELYPDEPAPDTNQTDTEIDTDISDPKSIRMWRKLPNQRPTQTGTV